MLFIIYVIYDSLNETVLKYALESKILQKKVGII